MTFGEKVKSARGKLGITQEELSNKLGVTRRIITSYETNNSRPRGIKAYRRLADALNVHVNYLLTEEETFVAKAEEEFGARGKRDARELMEELTGLFAGGEMAEEDMDELMLAVQEAYVIAKRNNRKYIPHKYRKPAPTEE